MKYLLVFLLSAIIIFPKSYSISGVVVDSENNKALQSANLFVKDLNSGASTDNSGNFIIENVPMGTYTLVVSYLGYSTEEINIELNKNLLLNIKLRPISINLSDLLIEGTFPKFRESSVAFYELNAEDINHKLGSKEAVHILEESPNIYISQQGGGIGEQRLNIRGFDQTNVSVMLNGVPLNNPENGEIYWSNWAGISDLIKFVHVQRGLSSVPYSTSSIGGNVNFITFGSSQNRADIKFKTEIGSYNLKKNSLSFSTSLDNGFHLTGLISKRDMDGYADQVYSDELTYYLALSMLLQDHTLQVQFFGSPQKHGQRLSRQSINNWNLYGKRYNADWGYLNGKPLNLRDNEFHNPTLNINYNWQISESLMLTNILSLSRGYGGGTVPPWFPELTRNKNGLINFDREWDINTNNIDENFHPELNRSIIALRKGVHKNYWGTFISAAKYNLNRFTINIGIDGKYYEAQNFNELSNLLGGDYYIGSNNINSDPHQLLRLGDKVDFNADSFTRSFGGFAQVEYKTEYLSAYLNFALSTTSYNRIDHFNYLLDNPGRETGWKNFTSRTAKTGVNYNLNSNNSFYFNIGNFSRAPLSNNVFDYSNNLYENVENENIISFEVGYGLRTNSLRLNVNYYNTVWEDKAFSQTYFNSDSTTLYYYNIFGASALHSGIEINGNYDLSSKLKLNASFSLSSNKWNSDVDAYLRPESNPADEIKYQAFTKGLYVGNHPMHSATIGVFYTNKLSKNTQFFINPIYSFYGKYYSDYDPEVRTKASEKGVQPWQLPDFFNVDLHSGVKFQLDNFFIKTIDFTFNIFNLLNEEYIIDAIDGVDHNAASARVWYGNRRYWSASLSLTF